MAIPSYGAPPLAKFFLVVRALQMLTFIIVIGLTANFVAEIVNNGYPACHEIIGTLTVVRSQVQAAIALWNLVLLTSIRLALLPSTPSSALHFSMLTQTSVFSS